MRTVFFTMSTFLFVGLGLILQGQHFKVILNNSPSLIVIIYLPLLAYLVFSEGFLGAFKFLTRLLKNESSDHDRRLIDTVVTLGFLLGGLASMFGITQGMSRLSEGTEQIGRCIAQSLLAGVFGAMPAILLLPLKGKISRLGDSSMLAKAGAFVSIVALGNWMTVFLVCWLLSGQGVFMW